MGKERQRAGHIMKIQKGKINQRKHYFRISFLLSYLTHLVLLLFTQHSLPTVSATSSFQPYVQPLHFKPLTASHLFNYLPTSSLPRPSPSAMPHLTHRCRISNFVSSQLCHVSGLSLLTPIICFNLVTSQSFLTSSSSHLSFSSHLNLALPESSSSPLSFTYSPPPSQSHSLPLSSAAPLALVTTSTFPLKTPRIFPPQHPIKEPGMNHTSATLLLSTRE